MEKYLSVYAEPEIAALDGLPDLTPWANVVTIPACNESHHLLRPPPACDGRSLMVLVINESETASREVSLNNQALAAQVQSRFESYWQSSPALTGFGLNLFRDPSARRDVLLVDRFTEGRKLPAKGGVGHARKIGADLASSLIHRQRILSPWIHCSDGDVHLPDTYFTSANALQNETERHTALIYPFHHGDDKNSYQVDEVVLATRLYELSLRYYVAGMKFARSPYAFHTIGSTMAVRASDYARVRGFPKREAGEDFYLLNKLAKLGSVMELEAGPTCKPLGIEARRSDRVPFGTGAAVNKITALAEPLRDFRFYNPAVFELLGQWLQVLPGIWQSRSKKLSANMLPAGAAGPDQFGVRVMHDRQQSLLAGLKEIGTQKALDHAFRQSKDLDQFIRQMHTWFDAFRTLKLIHALRDLHLPSISYGMLQANPVFQILLTQNNDLSDFYKQLQQRL